MTPELFLSTALVPGLKFLTATVGPRAGLTINWEDDAPARLLMLAIAGQESNWVDVQQSDDGAGMGPFQMQENTISEIQKNAASAVMYEKICAAAGLGPDPGNVWDRLLANPNVAVALARADLWCDRYPLPVYGDEAQALATYIRVWRPGAITEGGELATEARARFAVNYAQALAADKAWMAAEGAKT